MISQHDISAFLDEEGDHMGFKKPGDQTIQYRQGGGPMEQGATELPRRAYRQAAPGYPWPLWTGPGWGSRRS